MKKWRRAKKKYVCDIKLIVKWQPARFIIALSHLVLIFVFMWLCYFYAFKTYTKFGIYPLRNQVTRQRNRMCVSRSPLK